MKRQFEFLTAPSALQVELAVAPDPGPGAGREVVRAVRVERRRRLAAAGRPGHVRRDHLAVGGGDHEAARLRSLGTGHKKSQLIGHKDTTWHLLQSAKVQ